MRTADRRTTREGPPGRGPDRLRPDRSGYYHGGDLAGLSANLQRVKDLGFTALWLTPVLKQDPVENGSAAYHGYWGLDFTTVDPHLGSDQDFADLVAKAHGLGLKVYLDVVVNHTADIVQLTGTSYTDAPYRDCHGKKFNPARFVTGTFPCLKASLMPRVPFVLAGDRARKKPAWLNDPLNYHDRGNIDFGSCSQACFEQGDFFGLDDLFTEKPNVQNGLAQIYASWITRFKVDGFRVDTAKHVNAAFFRLWVPKIRAAARAAGISDFPIFGEVTLNDAVDLSVYVRDRGLPQVLDFPFQEVATGYASGASGAKGSPTACSTTTTSARRTASTRPSPPSSATTTWGAPPSRSSRRRRGSPGALLQHVLLGYDLLYLLRGAPAVLYGDEVGMIGSGGDQQARQDMFPTQVGDWRPDACGRASDRRRLVARHHGQPDRGAVEAARVDPRRASGARHGCDCRALREGCCPRRLAHRPGDAPRGDRRVQQRQHAREPHRPDRASVTPVKLQIPPVSAQVVTPAATIPARSRRPRS